MHDTVVFVISQKH